MSDSVTYQGKRYTAEVTKRDRAEYSVPCASYGTRRCAIDQPHNSYVHLVMALAESTGTIQDVR